MTSTLYSTALWRSARKRALARDNGRCTVARLLGGTCSGPLHVHHITPVADGGARYHIDNLGTACAHHHPKWEALRRALVRNREAEPERLAPRCPHSHTTLEARLLCEAKLARRRSPAAA